MRALGPARRHDPGQGAQWTIGQGRSPTLRSKPITVAGNRIMVVEDEALVAMALREALDEMGFSVIGPFNRISEAMVALRNNRIDAAVLDVNLGGELIYPLADVLVGRSRAIRLHHRLRRRRDRAAYTHTCPILQKPIEPEALKSVFARLDVSGSVEADPTRRMVG